MPSSAETQAQDVKFATYLWSRGYAALQLICLREKGAAAIAELKYRFMNGHGARHFVAGLKKLDIFNDPPAVAAAKYHYMSNCLVGDVPMEYVRETDKKAWIRYLAPAWAYPGTGLLACPASVQMAAFSAWHRNNGTWLGCPRLGYVCTKLYQYGEPYDEGYFIEYDHDITLDEAFRYEPVASSPDFDIEAAPTLDKAAWPPARLFKARRRYAESYCAVPTSVLVEMYGVPYAAFLVEQAMRGLGTQYAREISDRIGISGRDARSMAELFLGMLKTLGDMVSIDAQRDVVTITRQTFSPIHDIHIDPIYDAYFSMFPAILKVLTARVRLTRSVRQGALAGSRVEEWRFEDSTSRLF